MDRLKMLKWKLVMAAWDMETWLLAWARLLIFVVLYDPRCQTVGLSLSFCVQDVFEGRAPAFGRIMSATKAPNEIAWAALCDLYCQVYWWPYRTQARWLVRYLKWYNAIEQPRLKGENSHNTGHTHWLLGPVTRQENRWGNGDVLVGADGHRSCAHS